MTRVVTRSGMSVAATVEGVGDSPAGLLDAAMHSPAGLADPYPLLERLQATGEWFVADDGHVFVHGYEQSQATLRAPHFYKGGQHVSSATTTFTSEQQAVLRAEQPRSPGMLSSIDDPDHARLRRLVSIEFTPKAVSRLQDLTTGVFEDVVATLPRDEPVDLLSTLFTEIPSEVVGSLLGLPLRDRAHFAELAAVSSVGRDPEATFDEQLAAVRARRAMHEYIGSMIAEERRSPGDTLAGRLIRLEAEGERISDDEVVSLGTLMHSAGFGTTKRTLGNGIVALLRNPDQADALRADPTITRQATDEILRYDTTVMSVAYWSGEGAQVDGTPLEPGTLCTVLIGAANHDPRVFDEPSRFDVTRDRDEAPMSFGYGGHFCLGAALARMEVDVTIGPLLRRFPRMTLAEEPVRIPSFRSRTFDAVHVILEPTGASR
jgi:cytochrome P450